MRGPRRALAANRDRIPAEPSHPRFSAREGHSVVALMIISLEFNMADHFVDGPGYKLEPEVLDLASRIFDMARNGDAATLAAYLDAGVPATLTNTNGDTLVMLAVLLRTRVGGRCAGRARCRRRSAQQSRADSVGRRRLQKRDDDHGAAAASGCRSARGLAVCARDRTVLWKGRARTAAAATYRAAASG